MIFSHDAELIKLIKDSNSDARWNPEFKQWIIPINIYTKFKILKIIKDHNFVQIEKPVEKEAVFDYKRSNIDYAYLKGLCDSKGFLYTPRNYQLESLGYGLDKGSIINGDDVGLGKTFESIIYVEVTNKFPCLVITPASLKDQWKIQWDKITKGKTSVSVINSNSKKNNWDADVVIINYDIIGKKQGTGTTLRFSELAEIEWQSAIFDEAHFLKKKTSQRSQAAKMIVKKDFTVQLLTGTSVSSRPAEIWNLLVLLKKDKLIANDWFHFIRRYCGGYRGKFGWVYTGATNVLELNQKLRDNCYIRREKEEVLTELPEENSQIIQVPITNKKDIDNAVKDFIQHIKDTKGEEDADKAMEAEHLVRIGEMRRLSIVGKLKSIEQYLKDWEEAGNPKLVVFGIHRDPLDYLSHKFKSLLISGGTTSSKKQQIKNDWINNDDTFLFANIQSAGTGVDGLQDVCSNMLIIELPWNPDDLTQVIGRLHRSGQKSSVSVTFALNDQTIDIDMWDMLSDKQIVADGVNKGIDIQRSKSSMKYIIKKLLKKDGKK